MSLNFKKGSCLCKIDGGKYDNEVVYIYDNIDKKIEDSKII